MKRLVCTGIKLDGEKLTEAEVCEAKIDRRVRVKVKGAQWKTEPTMTDTKQAERMRERRPHGGRAKASRWKNLLGIRRDNQFTDMKEILKAIKQTVI